MKKSICLLLSILLPAGAGAQLLPVRSKSELLVKWRDGPESDSAATGNAAIGSAVKRNYKMIGWQLVQLPPGMSVGDGLKVYRAHGAVLDAEPNGSIQHINGNSSGADQMLERQSVGSTVSPNDPRFREQWFLPKIGATNAWATTTGSNNVVVAIFDTGVDYSHPDLAANMWRNVGETGPDANGKDKATNGIDDDGNGYIDDVHGVDTVNGTGDPMPRGKASSVYPPWHGTAVAGTIAAVGNNGVGIASLNWSAQIMAVRFAASDEEYPGGEYSTLFRNFWSDALAGYDYVIQMKRRGVNIRVTNTGYVIEFFSAALRDAIVAAGNEGILAVFPAYNSAANQDQFSIFPGGFHFDSGICVAASTESDGLASFSCHGASVVDLAAPGVNMICTWISPRYMTGLNGTSFACPIVTGAAALLLSKYPNLTIAEIKAALFGSVDQSSGLRGKVITNGRLNVARAFEYLTNPNPPAMVIHATPVGVWTQPNAPVKVTFNRPMSRSSVEQAFVINPPINGVFEWQDDSRSFSFYHELPFDVATNYTVRILGTARDDSGASLDGNFNRTRESSSADDFVWTFRFRIPNDDFGNAQALAGGSGSVSFSNRFAFLEAEEPINVLGDGVQYGSSVWYKWTPESSGWVTFDLTAGTTFDPLLAVYTGESLAALKLVAANDNHGAHPGSRVSFEAQRGTNYCFVVATKGDAFDPALAGNFKLAWYPTPFPGFSGTPFSPASAVPGTPITLTGTNFTGATAVFFNGASAAFTNALTNNLDLRITAIVPPNAGSGPLTVITPHGNVTQKRNK